MRAGDLSTKLLRPIHPVFQYAAGDLGHRLVLLTGLLPAFAVAVALLPGLDYDLTPARAVFVMAAVVLAYVLSIIMASAVALAGFWTTQTTNLWMLWWGLGSFASGWVAPLELMPGWLQDAGHVLPFWYAMGFPVELLLGRLDAAGIARGFAVGLACLALFVLLYRPLWRAGVRRFQVVGG